MVLNFYNKIRELDSKVKVCFMSGFDMNSAESREMYPSQEFECLISKPIQIKELVKIIETELLR